MRRRVLLSGLMLTGLAATGMLAGCEKPKPAAKPKAPETPPPAAASAQPAAPAMRRIDDLPPYDGPDTQRVSLMTEKGEIVVLLECRKAPITCNNFLHYIDTGKLDGAEFWRSSNQGGTGFVQAKGTAIPFPPIPHEPTTQTGLSHTNGTVSMTRFDPGTATNQFTISIGDQTYLDAGRDPKGDNLGYAAFGRVLKGMGVVKAILNGRISKDTPAGGWKGQMLAHKVKVLSAKRLDTEPQWPRIEPLPGSEEASSSS